MVPIPSAANGWPLIIGASPGILHAKDQVIRFAKTNAPARVEAESGSGKELFVKAIHVESGRTGPLVQYNCAEIPETLAESTLFGHEKGSFSGAHVTRRGLFEEAHRGTLHLDEIGELPLLLQPKLLRVLDCGEVRRVGGNRTRTVDVRIVAATNRDLQRMVEEGRFREDLYARLDGVRIVLPPLRERDGDIPLLVEHFAGAGRVTPEAMALLEAYDWPQNVRELKHVIESACALAAPGLVQPEHLRDKVRYASTRVRARDGRSVGRIVTLAEVEREHILAVMGHTRGNASAAARILGITRQTLSRKLIEYGWIGGSGSSGGER